MISIKHPNVFACVFVYEIFIEMDTKRGNGQIFALEKNAYFIYNHKKVRIHTKKQ